MSYISFQPSDYFNTVQWTGNGSTNSITGVGFQPDWVWGKSHTSGYSHQLYDAVRGATEVIRTNGTNSETLSTGLTSFDSDGFTLGSNTNINASGHTVTGWNWKANGQGSANTDGSINTTYTSANTTSGMSIIQYSGNGSAGATIGHGLGVAPKCVIIKRTDTTSNWIFGTGATGFTKFLYLNTADAETTNAGAFNNTAPSSSVITLGSWNDVNNSSGTYICYAFAEKQGFSKFGSYAGNANVDGPFVYTGFKPAFVVVKKIGGATANWVMTDNKISFNGKGTNNSTVLFPSTSAAESDAYGLMLHSNGFKFSGSDSASATVNGSGATYIFMAFAAAPLVSSNGVPTTAR